MTGGTGFVGGATIDQALAAGHSVRALARKPQREREGVTWVRGALDDPASLAQLCEGADVALHIAGVVNAPDRAGFIAGNITGTENVLAAAKAAGVDRFVHVSSLAARERALSNYCWSKAEAEDRVTASGLDWIMVRPPAVYGPGDTEMLDAMTLWKQAHARARETGEGAGAALVRAQTIGALGDTLVGDLIRETSRRLDEDPPHSLDDLRARPDPMVGFSAAVEAGKRELKSFLYENFYHHPSVRRRTRKAEWIVGDLFQTYRDDPHLLPRHVHERFAREGPMRAIADYIAGMTDRFAMDEHSRLLDRHAPI